MTFQRVASPTVRPSSEPTLSLGARGADVARLQRLLEAAGHSPRGADGDFGSNTRKAVLSFQRAGKLPVTGVADSATWKRLQQVVAAARERAFVAGTRDVTAQLSNVSRQVDAFTNDGQLTTTERQALGASLARARDAAVPLVAPQATAAFAALSKVELLTKSGALTTKAQEALGALQSARASVVKLAKQAAHGSPFPAGFSRAFNGVATRDLSVSGLKAHVVAIDLADPHVRLQTNPEARRGRSVESFARGAAAEVAINGDFFSWASHKPSGFAMTDGKQWAGSQQRSFEGFLAFNGRHAEVLGPKARNPDWSENAVSARPTVLVNGKLTLSDPAKNDRTARTGVGLSRDGRVLYLVAVEGKSGVKGLRATELGKFLRSLGADDAFALDSGGSAQLYVKGRGLVQRSTDPGGARAVANVVMVQSR